MAFRDPYAVNTRLPGHTAEAFIDVHSYRWVSFGSVPAGTVFEFARKPGVFLVRVANNLGLIVWDGTNVQIDIAAASLFVNSGTTTDRIKIETVSGELRLTSLFDTESKDISILRLG